MVKTTERHGEAPPKEDLFFECRLSRILFLSRLHLK